MQRQINKVRKHQPNASLSKLIDLGEFQADNKLSNDNLIKNIAQNFKMHRDNLRQGVVNTAGTEKTPRTPVHNRTGSNLIAVAGASPHHGDKNSPAISDRGCLFNQKEWKEPATEEWKINTKGMNDWKKATMGSSYSGKSPHQVIKQPDQEQMSNQSTGSILANHARFRTQPRNSLSQSIQQANFQDPTSTNPNTNPYKISNRNKTKDRKSSFILKAPSGVDNRPSVHYMTAYKSI